MYDGEIIMGPYHTDRQCPYCQTTCVVGLDYIQTDSPCPNCEETKFIDPPGMGMQNQREFILQVSNMQIIRWVRTVYCVQCKIRLDEISFESSLSIECPKCHETFRTGPKNCFLGEKSSWVLFASVIFLFWGMFVQIASKEFPSVKM